MPHKARAAASRSVTFLPWIPGGTTHGLWMSPIRVGCAAQGRPGGRDGRSGSSRPSGSIMVRCEAIDAADPVESRPAPGIVFDHRRRVGGEGERGGVLGRAFLASAACSRMGGSSVLSVGEWSGLRHPGRLDQGDDQGAQHRRCARRKARATISGSVCRASIGSRCSAFGGVAWARTRPAGRPLVMVIRQGRCVSPSHPGARRSSAPLEADHRFCAPCARCGARMASGVTAVVPRSIVALIAASSRWAACVKGIIRPFNRAIVDRRAERRLAERGPSACVSAGDGPEGRANPAPRT